MITKEHLEHWIKEIRYQLQGISNEAGADKEHVSLDYINEKITTIHGTINCIEEDVKLDGGPNQDDLKNQLDNIDKDELIEYVVKNLFGEIKEAIQEASRP